MRPRLPVLLFLAVLPFGVFAAGSPNVILIYTDDHGWPDIGAAGIYEDLKTPHLDELAASGVRATNGYSTAPQCVPSRAGLLAGRFQNRFGVESNSQSLAGFDAEITVAEKLQQAGYATGQIGKWHLGPTNAITRHGFDDVYSKNANRPCHANYTLEGNTIPMQLVDDGRYHLDACSDAAVAFINRHGKEPFFLYLAYRAPHVPLDAPKKYLSRFPGEMPERRRQALAMISAMDDGVGKIRAELKAKGLLEKTLIFFIGDNGAPLKIHKIDAPGGGPGWDGSLNKPMNGEKGMLAEGGIRVPFLISWPGTIPKDQVYEEPITALDATATAIALAGLPRGNLDGVNLLPYLKGEKSGSPHDYLTWRWVAQSAVRYGNWKFLKGGTREYLFNLKDDPGEQNDLLQQNPEVAAKLRKHLEAWATELNPPGLATKAMSGTWERYYDHYLDGKPVELTENPKPDDLQGWKVRNGSLSRQAGGLQIKANDEKRLPFLVTTAGNVRDSFKAEIRLKPTAPGNIAIAWRRADQRDFSPDQIVSTGVKPEAGFQDISLEIPLQGKADHLRIHLPGGHTVIEKISFGSGNGRSWSFK